MKKSILLFTTLSFFFTNSYSQNFRLEDQSGSDITNSAVNVYLTADDLADYYNEVIYYAKFVNLTNESKSINAKRRVVSEVTGSENLLCWAICHPPSVDISNPLSIPAQTTNQSFSGHYKARQNPGTTLIEYVFFDENNTNDSVYLRVTYTSGTSSISKNNAKPTGLSFYPNPTNNSLNISLNSTSNTIKEIKITNILGTVVKSQSLGKLENSVVIKTEDLEDGVYFVSVVSNGKIENTKRLVVKH
jgi:hypothetical protein